MNKRAILLFLAALFFLASGIQRTDTAVAAEATQHGHLQHQNKSALLPAEGASVKILSPKNGQTIKGDQIPLEFNLVKGKKGEHIHAYINGELMGMFKSEKGNLTGIRSGTHTLEVVRGDHQTELNATDRVKFTVK